MSRVRISTTVDEALLQRARRGRSSTDAKLVEAALLALLASERAAEVDASYRAYDVQPLDVPDAWGDVESWRRAAGAS